MGTRPGGGLWWAAGGPGPTGCMRLAAADIGVRLTGQEGMQVVRNSDYMLAQFCLYMGVGLT